MSKIFLSYYSWFLGGFVSKYRLDAKRICHFFDNFFQKGILYYQQDVNQDDNQLSLDLLRRRRRRKIVYWLE